MARCFRRTGIVPLAVISLATAAFPLGVTAAGAVPGARSGSPPTVRLAEATLIVEVNATDGDAGLQVFLDGDPWRSMKIVGPNGQTVLDVQTKGRLTSYGLTELFSESSEPPFEVFPLEKFRSLFPPGKYTFTGTTIEGKRVAGSARLSHALPDGPEITSPAAGAILARADRIVARWNPVKTPRGIVIRGYRAIVTREDPLRVFSADLPAAATSVTIPSEFFEPSTDYKLEVQAIARSGNQTLTEVEFRIR